ncbi:MAG TPA: paraquat-inducible protein A [Saprospiraceae bacterium]|nr:paraquat-inducible protein A [Saprospiraceae bacterium]
MSYKNVILPALVFIIIAVSIKFSRDIIKVSNELTELKEQYAEVNRINYGLFNIQLWKNKAFQLFRQRASSFTISPQVYKDVESQLVVYLDGIYTDYIESGQLINQLIQESERSGKLNPLFANIIRENVGDQIKNMNIRARLPDIARSLAMELKANEPRLRLYIAEGLESMLFEGPDRRYIDPRQGFFYKLGYQSIDDYNESTLFRIKELYVQMNKMIRWVYLLLLGSVVALLFLGKWTGIITSISLITTISIVFLILGVTLPMIDIDARLNGFRMDILDDQIEFDEQFMYYQSKSILDVTWTLLEGRGIDLKIVGILVLLFSIVIPFFKLILSSLFMFSRRIENSLLVQWIVFYLGKWSMADVFVVAMFMSYIGFHGVITSQLTEISRNQTGYAVETLNYSKLSPGALFFTTYCVLSIITGLLIHRWYKEKQKNP